MKKEYDFSKGKRGAVLKPQGKTRITIYLDDEVIETFRSKAEEAGRGYQTLINDALRQQLSSVSKPVDSKTLRRILREELQKTS
ncbi:MAG: BrnA antitoxin family protein [Xanthomonadales bacterium]|nr:BrnA antitoxin family protein [Xanthomonadales bacterium]